MKKKPYLNISVGGFIIVAGTNIENAVKEKQQNLKVKKM